MLHRLNNNKVCYFNNGLLLSSVWNAVNTNTSEHSMVETSIPEHYMVGPEEIFYPITQVTKPKN